VPGSSYIALSGLRARLSELDRLASDLANASTTAYKAERASAVASERPTFEASLRAAVDVAPGPVRVDFGKGALLPTGNALDMGIDGRGFFVVDTPWGARYTRDGHFVRSAEGALTTLDGHPIRGENGPLTLGIGEVSVDEQGNIRSGDTLVGRPLVVDFPDYTKLDREGSVNFRAPAGVVPAPSEHAVLRSGTLEQSNVSVVERMTQLVEVTRSFEAMQRAITLLMNDIDGRAITDLGRR
jgi:flagellar basal body rod protein FlgG